MRLLQNKKNKLDVFKDIPWEDDSKSYLDDKKSVKAADKNVGFLEDGEDHNILGYILKDLVQVPRGLP